MSVSFYGLSAEGGSVILGFEDPDHLNLANGNAVALLVLLGLATGSEEDLAGEVSLPEARRAVIRARATHERRAPTLCRAPSDTRRPGEARVVVAGIDPEYLARRVDDFERCVDALAARGAVRIYWA